MILRLVTSICILLLSIVTAHSATFSQSDLQGAWYFMAEQINGDGVSSGIINFDGNGSVIPGGSTENLFVGSPRGTFVAGKVAITVDGFLSGSVTSSLNAQFVLERAKLDEGKRIAVAHVTSPDGSFGRVTLIKDGTNAVTLAAGKYKIAVAQADATTVGISTGYVELDTQGKIVPDTENGIASGFISTSPTGRLTGRIVSTTNVVSNIIDGKATSDGNIGLFAFVRSNFSEGVSVAIRKLTNPSFSTADLGGKWFLVALQGDGGGTWTTFGTIDLDASGKITASSVNSRFSSSSIQAVPVSGQFTLSDQGDVAGNFLSQGVTTNVTAATLDAQRQFISGIWESSNNTLGEFRIVKVSGLQADTSDSGGGGGCSMGFGSPLEMIWLALVALGLRLHARLTVAA